MRTAIVSYDLKHVTLGDNLRVKSKLAGYENTFTTFQALNRNSLLPEWVNFRLPDTTLCVSVNNPLTTTELIANEVMDIIKSVDAIPDKVFVAFITEGFICNDKN